MNTVICPEPGCSARADVLDRWSFASTGGPLTHLKIRCEKGHCLTPRLEQVTAVEHVTAPVDAAA